MADDSTDWARVRSHLAAHGLTLDHDPAPRRFSGGLANINYLIHLDGKPAVLRRPPPGKLPPGAHDMAREHRILTALPKALDFVPRGLFLCTDQDVTGVSFQIIEFREGRTIRDRLPDDVATPVHAAALSETILQTMAAIHAVDPGALGLGDLGRPEGFLRRAVDGWVRRGAASQTTASAARIAELGTWLDRHIVPDSKPVMLHNDLKLDNMILSPELKPVGVVDWDQGTRGDRLFDLGTSLSYWTEAGDPEVMHQLAQMPTAAPGFLTREQAANRYAAITGADLSDFRFFRVLGLMKLGVIFQQLGALHTSGATSDPRYLAFGPLGAGLFEVALDVSSGRIF
jgi:aminoglycoside phosphotransferase (APT) family kinase protein